MRLPISRPRPAAVVLIAATVAATGWSAAPAVARDPSRARISVERFMVGLGCWESGGRYDVRNSVSGAYGKYQVMPFNWPVWARDYLGRGRAPQTPANQERVVRAKLLDLYRWRGTWPRVALWWLTGIPEDDRSQWSGYATGFVKGVLSLARRSATAAGRRSIPESCFSEPQRGERRERPSRRDGRERDGRERDGRERDDRTPGSRTEVRVVVADILNIRAGPGVDHPAVSGLLEGARVAPLRSARDGLGRTWYEIDAGHGRRGWIAGWWSTPGG